MTYSKNAAWVGKLDLDGIGSVRGVCGPLLSQHVQARVLIRLHRAPLGYVSVVAHPWETLTARTRAAASVALKGALRKHAESDESLAAGNGANWPAWAACPRHFTSVPQTGVTIIVCTRDRPESLRDCLRALREVRHHPLEILVVDNAPSEDATRALVTAAGRVDPRVRYTCEPRPGLSRARNHGLANASFDLVAFTDDDTLADAEWASAIVAGFTADPEAVCVTGPVASSALDTASQQYFDVRYSSGEAFEPQRYDLAANRVPSRLYPFSAGILGKGANFAVRATAVTGIGGFDPVLGAGAPGRGGEDLDMFLRLILAGGRICYMPSALVWHRHRADPRALREQVYSYGHGLGAFTAKHLPNRQFQVALLGHGLGQARMLAGHMRRASAASQLGSTGKRLALTEARGFAVGAVRYHRAAHMSAGS